ncbi:hypothetical protein DVH05_021870 [Phytophthora capsici]|nr:hypothetical protein DVH05_021870 [Phytophthora capsici]
MTESPTKKQKMSDPLKALNLIGGEFVPPMGGQYINVVSPSTGEVIGECALSTHEDVNTAVAKGQEAFKEWRQTTIKTRAGIMLKFHSLMMQHKGNRVVLPLGGGALVK